MFCSCSVIYSQESSLRANLEFLTSDEMKGRENGSPELLEAAEWIAEKFKDAGLVSPSYADNYLQIINLVESETQYQNLILNNLSVVDNNYFILGQFEKIQITNSDSLKLFVVGEDEDMMLVFSQIQEYDKSYAIFVHPAHKKRFERLKRYFTNSQKELEKDLSYYSLWVMTEDDEINNLQLNVIKKRKITSIYNVIGELPSDSSSDRKWLYSAHYDHIGIISKVNGDSIANGANDDASGVAAVIELSKKFAQGEKPEKTILFIAFAGEELGLFGSKYLSSKLDLSEIEAMINIEIIGYPNEVFGPQSAYISGYELSYLPDQMASNTDQEEFMFFPDPYPELSLFTRSDNAPFAAHGIPAHTVSTYTDTDSTYHTVHDEFEALEIEHIMEVIEAIYNASIPMLKLDYSPGVIDYKTKNDR